MKRINYLIATILAAIVLAGQTVLNGMIALNYLRALISFGGGGMPFEALLVLGFYCLVEAIIVVALILTLVGIKYIGKDKEGFKKGKALIITNIVFIFLTIAILAYYSLQATSTFGPMFTIIYLVSAGVLLVSNILYIVDLAKEKNRGEAPKVAEPVAEQPVAVEEPKVEAAPAKKAPAKKTATTKKPAAKTPAKKPTTAARKTTTKKTTATKKTTK